MFCAPTRTLFTWKSTPKNVLIFENYKPTDLKCWQYSAGKRPSQCAWWWRICQRRHPRTSPPWMSDPECPWILEGTGSLYLQSYILKAPLTDHSIANARLLLCLHCHLLLHQKHLPLVMVQWGSLRCFNWSASEQVQVGHGWCCSGTATRRGKSWVLGQKFIWLCHLKRKWIPIPTVTQSKKAMVLSIHNSTVNRNQPLSSSVGMCDDGLAEPWPPLLGPSG